MCPTYQWSVCGDGALAVWQLCCVLTPVVSLQTKGDIGNYYYGQGHPMKPHRIRMTHNLLLNYGLYRKMEIYVSISRVPRLPLRELPTLPRLRSVNERNFILLFPFQRPHKAILDEMTRYHSDDYVKFLKTIKPDNMSEYTKQMQRCEFKVSLVNHA